MRLSCRFLNVFLPVLVVPLLINSVAAQGLSQSPYSAPAVVRGGLDLSPSNPLGMPGTTGGFPRGSDSIYLTDQMFRDILGPIPNLQVGYQYYFGKRVRTGRLTLDYLLPVSLGSNSAVFAEAHGEFTNFWKTISSIWRQVYTTPTTITTTTTTPSSFNERTDLSFGGGYRKIFGETTLLGVNGFCDVTRLGRTWYNSGSVGLEFAALLPGYDVVDLTVNWYGNLFRGNVLANAFRRGPQDCDFQAGYSHELWNGGPDLRLSATGYRFSAGPGAYGVRGGAELRSRDGMYEVRYEAAHDRVNGTYHMIGGFVNVGIQLGNLLNGGSPFVMPEPIFKSPRNFLRRLSRRVTRKVDATNIVASHGVGRVVTICVDRPQEWRVLHPKLRDSVPHITAPMVLVRWHNITGGLGGHEFLFADGTHRWESGIVNIDTQSNLSGQSVDIVERGILTWNSVVLLSGSRMQIGADGFICFTFTD